MQVRERLFSVFEERLFAVWLPALVLLCHVSMVSAADPSVDGGSGNSITLEVTSHLGDNQTFREGDVVSFLLSLDRDAYLLLVYQDAAGTLVKIFPDPSNPSGFIRAAQFLDFPFKGSSFQLRVTSPFGHESLWIFAASAPFPALEGRRQNDGAVILDKDVQWLLDKMRRHGRLPGMLYGEARTMLTTEAAIGR